MTQRPAPAAETAPPAACPALSDVTRNLNAWIEIDTAALEANARLLQQVAAPAEVIAVVKANAYGAGMAPVARLLWQAGIRSFAVAWVSEALELRRAGLEGTIIVLGHAMAGEAAGAVEYDITLSCDSLELGQALSRAALAQAKRAAVHVHVDTGLHRDGVSPAEAVPLADALRALPGVVVEGLSTHMANADEVDDSFSDAQQERFAEVFRDLDWIPFCHTANSATALRRPEFRRHGVRIGLALHGVAPENTPGEGLRPILQLKARLARVFDVEAGEGASYGLTWKAQRPSRLGLVPVGYADGWRRGLGNTGHVLVTGKLTPIAGRVCMDQFLVDITDIPSAELGSEVVLIGEQGEARIPAAAVAETLGTIPWEVLSGLQTRIPRLYHREGAIVARG